MVHNSGTGTLLNSVGQKESRGNTAKAVNTACYVLNRVLVTKPQNKTPYELLTGKFEEKSGEGFLVGYSLSSKAFRPITVENKANKTTGPKETNNSAAKTLRKTFAQNTEDLLLQARTTRASSTNYVNTDISPLNVASTPLNTASTPTNQDDSHIPSLEDIYEVSRDGIFTSASYDDEGTVADFTNLETTMNVKWIENEAKTGIYGFVAIKNAYYSKSRQSHEKPLSMLFGNQYDIGSCAIIS
nr:hypothetical protein [Tanacetum cinerariifolium]